MPNKRQRKKKLTFHPDSFALEVPEVDCGEVEGETIKVKLTKEMYGDDGFCKLDVIYSAKEQEWSVRIKE